MNAFSILNFRMKPPCQVRRVFAGVIVILTSISFANMLPHRTKRDASIPYKKNCSLPALHLIENESRESQRSFRIDGANASLNGMNQTDQKGFNLSTTINVDCSGDQSQAICHSYIHNMYQFYSTIGGFLMLAIVCTGISFLIVTHFHGRHIVKTNQHVVGKIAKWDAIQHRKQQSRERTNNWI